ncbi:hypothetical protein Ocin01_12643 [Orchesella cincta]|uniref:Uncharacterized protein n=1 Tax=Orchesella cincta TaxID=48709 RepID=A0A1D2MMJ4_ORCCI|nr:hypothetical protein Ocin01_12643 [Orchesella cincta]
MGLWKISMINFIIFVEFALKNVQCEELDSNSYSYSDEDYYQLAAEYQQYQDDLPMPAVHKAAEANKLDESASAEYLQPAGITQEHLFRKELMNGLPYCYYWYKMRNRKNLDKLREKYSPGRIELANGKIGSYQPTAEEYEAYEELIKAIIVQEMYDLI